MLHKSITNYLSSKSSPKKRLNSKYNILYVKSKRKFVFMSLRKCKRRNKGNFTLKSNSNKIMVCGGSNILFLSRFKLDNFIF